MSDEHNEMTEQEQAEAGRAMLSAALDVLGKFSSDIEEDQDEIARRVILALVAASNAEEKEREKFTDLYKNRQCIETEPNQAVATAFWMWSEKVDLDVSEVSASSKVGLRYLGFAQGLAAARAMTEALDLLDEGSLFAFTSRGAKHLAQKLG